VPKDEYAEYERAVAAIREDNAKLMADFEQWLSEKGLAGKTIERHVENGAFYINTFLLYSDAVPARKGVSQVWSFFVDWFIRKTMWASPNSMKQMAGSLHQFSAYSHSMTSMSLNRMSNFLPGWIWRPMWPFRPTLWLR